MTSGHGLSIHWECKNYVVVQVHPPTTVNDTGMDLICQDRVMRTDLFCPVNLCTKNWGRSGNKQAVQVTLAASD